MYLAKKVPVTKKNHPQVTSKVSDDLDDQTKEIQPPTHKKHKKKKKNKKDKREKGEVDSISGLSGSNPAHLVPTPLNIKDEPTVTEEVNDSKFEKFKTALLKFFKAKRQENLPIEKVKKAIIEMTSLTEEQLLTCIEKGIDLNLITLKFVQTKLIIL